jgi:ABC-2 type transport system ATP-binding protein
VLFLDEPTIGLDAVSKVAVRDFIKRINKENGVTVVLTTHDMGDVEALCDRVILIGRGEILYDGSFAGMKEQYTKSGGADGAARPVEEIIAGMYTELSI